MAMDWDCLIGITKETLTDLDRDTDTGTTDLNIGQINRIGIVHNLFLIPCFMIPSSCISPPHLCTYLWSRPC